MHNMLNENKILRLKKLAGLLNEDTVIFSASGGRSDKDTLGYYIEDYLINLSSQFVSTLDSEFKKINKIVGLYYNNPFGNSTTQEKDKKNARQKEEKEVFYKYKNVFGENNFNLFKPYFDNF